MRMILEDDPKLPKFAQKKCFFFLIKSKCNSTLDANIPAAVIVPATHISKTYDTLCSIPLH